MIPGNDILGDVAIGDTAADELIVADKISQLLADSGANRVYLLEATPYDPGAEAETTVRLSGPIPFRTKPTDTPANASYQPRLRNPYNYSVNLWQNNRVLGERKPSFGAVVIDNPDGGLDNLLDYYWDGRQVNIKVGTPDFTFAEFEVLFSGTVSDIEWSDTELKLNIRDPGVKLDKPIQTTLYAGTGSDEGGSELKGKPKPLCYGIAREVKAVLVDNVDLIYQVHDGSVDEITAVYDKGATLTDEGDVADLRAAPAPSAGAFKTDEAAGLFRLGASPDGQVTADVRGDNSGGFVSAAADIAKRILTTKGALVTADLDEASFNRVTASSPAAVGIAIPDEQRQIPEVLTELMANIGGFWTHRRNGKLRVGVLQAPGSASLKLGQADVFGVVSRRHAGRPAETVRLGYDRTWTVQQEGALAASLSADEKALRSNPHRFVESSDATIANKHLLADVVERLTAIDSDTDAQAEADRLLELLKTRRHIYKVGIGWRLFALDLVDTVTLDLPRFGLDGGVDYRIIGITENAAANSAELILWG
ncbi:MAG: hypothetical protein CMN85_10830 [Spongiibacteraceae bacterium]|uniref:hypothetical protein n=1 Tax=uncultured Haliea sp. TaxID=622616 RepID=UPI000C6AA479|nr:hypothetical protein [Spongiibacteraceae bacterium]|tara:strand:+ start:4881 stop:6491 length:1611 start_codon:yes stop_codon:yes gene_type:complete